MKIVYLISSLQNVGPVNVLYEIVNTIDKSQNEVFIITLKKPSKDVEEKFISCRAKCICLNVSFLQSFLYAANLIKEKLEIIKPDIVHAHCFRTICFLAQISGKWKTCATIHCYPHLDFVYEYGCLVGGIMSRLYIRALRKIDAPIACSRSIKNELQNKFSLNTYCVRNGTSKKPVISDVDFSRFKKTVQQKVFLCVSCFNKRKNQRQLLEYMQEMIIEDKISIVFLGDGTLRKECMSKKLPNTYFLGNIDNVYDYYAKADGIISASNAEGMPMAVIEALLAGIPRCILSDIPPHRELKSLFADEILLIDFGKSMDNYLFNKMLSFIQRDNEKDKISLKAGKYLSAEFMSRKYLELYEKLSLEK